MTHLCRTSSSSTGVFIFTSIFSSVLSCIFTITAAATGQRQLANEIAARLDASPAGAMSLTTTVKDCFCGAPFDIEVTPNFRARIQEAGLSWPPPSPIKYPAKNW